MIWLFATVVLILAVYHAQFRKVLLWTAGGVATVVVLGLLAMSAPHYDQQPVQTGTPAAFDPYAFDPDEHKKHEAWCASASSSDMMDDARTAFLVKGACSPP